MSRVKTANYNGSCGYCWQHGHDAKSCPRLKTQLESGSVRAKKFSNNLNGGGRVCGYCADKGHSSTNCSKRFDDYVPTLAKQKAIANQAFSWLHEIGFGPGAMLSAMATESGWRAANKDQRMVIIEEFNERVANNFFQELLYGQQRNWYHVKAVDTANEDVRRIYLPFHPHFAPRPTSMKVEVLHKANPEDIDSMKKFIPALTSPALDYNTAEEFFAAGYRFNAGNSQSVSIKRIHN